MKIGRDLQQLCYSLQRKKLKDSYITDEYSSRILLGERIEIVEPFNPNYIDYICQVFRMYRITEKKLKSKTRKREIVYARFICYHYLTRTTIMSLESIGDIFNKNHATVLSGLRNYKNFEETNDVGFLKLVEEFNSKIEKI